MKIPLQSTSFENALQQSISIYDGSMRKKIKNEKLLFQLKGDYVLKNTDNIQTKTNT